MVDFFKKNLFLLIILGAALFTFQKTIFFGLLPIPSDTIIGLYHPYRDLYAKDYPNGIPFKNFLITDPVRQIFPWKNLTIAVGKNMQLPLWNPYSFSGTPLLANFQSGAFYPGNFLFFTLPFDTAWTLFIILQPILAGVFMFLYLRNLGLKKEASIFGSLTFAFGGFFVAWLEWGNILHTALWLPLILLSIDRVIKDKKNIFWSLVLLFSLCASFFAGHLQIFFYISVVSAAYAIFTWFEHGKKLQTIFTLSACLLIFLLIGVVQWLPTLQFILLSARGFDQSFLQEGWFLPWQNLIQFVSPDFFGNPTTLNYWGVWNYGEFMGYVGIAALIFSLFAVIKVRSSLVRFFSIAIVIALVLCLQNPISEIPYQLSIPFFSSSQPTRLIFIISFSLAVLAAFGLDQLIKENKANKSLCLIIGVIASVFILLWITTLGLLPFNISPENLLVAKRNLIFPTIIFLISGFLIFLVSLKNSKYKLVLISLIIILSFFDLARLGTKFTPFTNKDYLFPNTKIIQFLKSDKSVYRIASTDSQIFPPNFSTYYRIQSVEGYDPLYLLSYAELIAASERNDANINPPFGFNRIITPHNINSPIINLLNVKYVLSFSDLSELGFRKVFQEGRTIVFENPNFFERAFFVEKVLSAENKSEAAKLMFANDLQNVAVIDNFSSGSRQFVKGKSEIISYSENKIKISSENTGEGFLVLTDAYYPTWKASIDGKPTKIYKTNYAFRGVNVPRGKHIIEFTNSLF